MAEPNPSNVAPIVREYTNLSLSLWILPEQRRLIESRRLNHRCHSKGIWSNSVVQRLMNILLLLLVLLPVTIQAEPNGVVYDVEILRVIDGDTVAYAAPFLPDPLKKELSIRVYGVDTPEKTWRASCPSEAERGERATQFTKHVVDAAKKKQIRLIGWDKYGGRVLGDIILDGKSLREMLIANGLARPYFGDKKETWCEIK